MRIVKLILLPFLAALYLSGCAGAVNPADLPPVTQQEVATLSTSILALGPNIDPKEAQRVAEIAYKYPRQLAIEYQITDHPLIHNTKVNAGTRPRGLCWHWAEDLENRLAQENFKTLDLHRSIANSRKKPFRIEHSTVLVSHQGGTMYQGLVLDPWRNGGLLYWGPPLEDKSYEWLPVDVVFAERRAKEG